MCQCLKVNRSCYYDWCASSTSYLSTENTLILAHIVEIFEEGRQNYGTRRIKRALLKRGFVVSRRRIGRLMKSKGLHCKTKKKFRVTTDSCHQQTISDNHLGRQFNVTKPDKCYVGDITYIYTQEGWLYLAVVIDLFSRKVVGWSMDKNMHATLVNNALLMAVWKRKPMRGLLWHTDRGSQYASAAHREILKQHGIKQSMSRKGNCWDNAVSESFFHTLKTELVHQRKFKTREEAKRSIFEFIEVFYNRIRMHSANDYLSPEEFEETYYFN